MFVGTSVSWYWWIRMFISYIIIIKRTNQTLLHLQSTNHPPPAPTNIDTTTINHHELSTAGGDGNACITIVHQ